MGRGVSRGYNAGARGRRGRRGCAGKVLEPRMKSTRVCGRGARPGQGSCAATLAVGDGGGSFISLARPRGDALPRLLGRRTPFRMVQSPSQTRTPAVFFFSSALPPTPPGCSRATDSSPRASAEPPQGLPEPAALARGRGRWGLIGGAARSGGRGRGRGGCCRSGRRPPGKRRCGGFDGFGLEPEPWPG